VSQRRYRQRITLYVIFFRKGKEKQEMNFFNSQEKPEEKPEEMPTVEVPAAEAPEEAPAEMSGEALRDALLKATEDVSPSNPVDVCVPDGLSEDVWVPVFNDCHNRQGNFAHLGVHIKASMCQDNGTVLTITDASETMPKPQAMPKPIPPKTWPVGPAEPLPEEDSE
jgi:hypothetical protein